MTRKPQVEERAIIAAGAAVRRIGFQIPFRIVRLPVAVVVIAVAHPNPVGLGNTDLLAAVRWIIVKVVVVDVALTHFAVASYAESGCLAEDANVSALPAILRIVAFVPKVIRNTVTIIVLVVADFWRRINASDTRRPESVYAGFLALATFADF
jgi:hypothetical protein